MGSFVSSVYPRTTNSGFLSVHRADSAAASTHEQPALLTLLVFNTIADGWKEHFYIRVYQPGARKCA